MLESTSEETHIYTRHLNPDGQDSLAMIARLVQAGKTVLDLGAGTGALGHYLSSEKRCTVDGIEGQAKQAEMARPGYRNLQVTDLEVCDLSKLFSEAYDYIVCADVLEHLAQPERIMTQLSQRLAPGGRIILSIPNIAYAGAILDLMAGEFRYRPEGILDATHLRFFTRHSLIDFIHQQGFIIQSFESVQLDIRESEFRGRYADTLPPMVAQFLLANPDALSYQFIVAITPGKLVDEKPLPVPEPSAPLFATRLYWLKPEGDYTAEHSAVVYGQIGVLRQTQELGIPVLDEVPQRLRLDLADRPGFVRIHAIALLSSNGQQLWEWDKREQSLSAEQGALVLGPLLDKTGVTVLIEDETSFLELPVSTDALTALQAGGKLLLDLSFPQSADFMALLPRVEQLEKQKQDELDARERLILERDQLLEEQSQEIETRGRLILERDELLEHKNRQILEREELITERENVIELKDELLEEQNQEIKQRGQLIAERDELLDEQYQEMLKREQLIAERESVIGLKDQLLDEQNEAISQRGDIIAERDALLQAQNTEINQRGSIIADRDTLLQEQHKEISFRGQLIAERDEWLELRNQQKDEYESIIHALDARVAEQAARLADQNSFSGWLRWPVNAVKSRFLGKN